MSAGLAQDLVGAVLNGRWRLVRLLGEGGMGAVFEAEGPPGTGRRAIKLLHQEFIREDAILSRFFTEAQATRGLAHPNITQVLETGTAENGTPYLVMELLQGIPVSTYVEQGQVLPPPQAVHIAHGVLQALGTAHGRGVIHRDIKPDNLFLVHDANGSFLVKVLDFGIAKVMDVAGGMGQKTRTGVLLGTPGYMSPEQIKNSKTVDERADLWSVGIIFYELLTGTSPFPAENEFARLTSVLTEEIQPIEQVAPHLASWSGFFQRALAKDPAWRFKNADEMSAALLATARAQKPSMHPVATLQAGQPAIPKPAPAPQLPYGPDPTPAPRPAPQSPYEHTPLPRPAPQSPYEASHIGPKPGMATTPMAAIGESPSGIGPTPGSLPFSYSQQNPTRASSAVTPAPPMASQSGVMNTPGFSYPVPAVSQGSIPPSRVASLPSTPPPPLSSSVVGEAVGGVGPTHVSAQHPGPVAPGYTPSIEVVDAPPRVPRGAAWWVVGLVGFMAFGLGLALGLAMR